MKRTMVVALLFLVAGCSQEQNTMSFRTAATTYQTVAGSVAQNVDSLSPREREVVGRMDLAAYTALEMWYNALMNNDEQAERKAIQQFTKAMFDLKRVWKELRNE
jgi:hypothetical protein